MLTLGLYLPYRCFVAVLFFDFQKDSFFIISSYIAAPFSIFDDKSYPFIPAKAINANPGIIHGVYVNPELPSAIIRCPTASGTDAIAPKATLKTIVLDKLTKNLLSFIIAYPVLCNNIVVSVTICIYEIYHPEYMNSIKNAPGIRPKLIFPRPLGRQRLVRDTMHVKPIGSRPERIPRRGAQQNLFRAPIV